MVERVKAWLARGQEVRIFTDRACLPAGPDLDQCIAVIESWCVEHIGQALPVTCAKDSCMAELWDDRAVQVRFNAGEAVQ